MLFVAAEFGSAGGPFRTVLSAQFWPDSLERVLHSAIPRTAQAVAEMTKPIPHAPVG